MTPLLSEATDRQILKEIRSRGSSVLSDVDEGDLIGEIRRRGLCCDEVFDESDLKAWAQSLGRSVAVDRELLERARIALSGGDLSETLHLLGAAIAAIDGFYGFHGLDQASRKYFRINP